MPFSKEKNNKKINDPQEAFLKARMYCAYQERSQQEVRDKLYEMGIVKEVLEDILVKLIEENFLNEERFAIAYAGGKFRIKKWGNNKIRNGLKLKGTSDYCIKKGLAAIDAEQYQIALREILEKKLKEVKEKNSLKANYKVAQYAIGKGFESNLVWEHLTQRKF